MNGWPGDILTLADETPTRVHRVELLWAAADKLCSMHRFEAAVSVLQDLLELDPEHRDAKARIGLALGHTGRVDEAKAPPRFAKVFVCSGHMIDAPGRKQERFPPRQEKAVRAWMAKQLADWKVGKGHLAICGGARGADLLFAELCANRGAEVWLMLPLPEAKFLDESVRLPDSDWVDRFHRIKKRPEVKVFLQQDHLEAPPAGADVFARNNLWMLNTARVEADDAKNLYALLVWDGESTGDGPGGTSDFVARVGALGGHRECVNPLEA